MPRATRHGLVFDVVALVDIIHRDRTLCARRRRAVRRHVEEGERKKAGRAFNFPKLFFLPKNKTRRYCHVLRLRFALALPLTMLGRVAPGRAPARPEGAGASRENAERGRMRRALQATAPGRPAVTQDLCSTHRPGDPSREAVV